MSSSSPDAESEAESSLFDPPTAEDEDLDVNASSDREILELTLSQDLARQLLDVATHLGLSPSMVASRAIDLVCDEVGTIDDDPLSTGTLIQQYQARLDLLHTLEEDPDEASEDADEESSWAAVDEIIEAGERGRGAD